MPRMKSNFKRSKANFATKEKMRLENEAKKPKFIESRGEGSGYHSVYTVGKDEVEIYPPAIDDFDGSRLPWRVVWNGAVDFEGNKKDLLSRYPQFKGEV